MTRTPCLPGSPLVRINISDGESHAYKGEEVPIKIILIDFNTSATLA